MKSDDLDVLIKRLRIAFPFNPDFDLKKHCEEALFDVDYVKAIGVELQRVNEDTAAKVKLIMYLEKAINQTLKLSTQERNELSKSIEHLNSFKDKLVEGSKISFPVKKYKRSQSRKFINRFIGIFHEGTGLVPDCNKDGRNDSYCGICFDFLIASKPIWQSKGIYIDDKTIGKYAYQTIRGDKKKVITPYSELLTYFEK